MTRPRLMHDCNYCGRTKFADETLFCCVEDEYERLTPEGKAQVDRAIRHQAWRERRTEWVRVSGQKMYADLTDEVGR